MEKARQTWEAARAASGDDDPATLSAAREYAFALSFDGRSEPAIVLMTDVLERVRRLSGAESTATVTIAADLGWMLAEAKRYAAAEPLLDLVLRVRLRDLPPTDRLVLSAIDNLAETQVALGRGADRLADYDALAARRAASLGPQHAEILKVTARKAQLLLDLKRPREAEPLLRQILTARQASTGGDPRDVIRARKRLAEVLEMLGRQDEAVSLYREAWRADQATPDPSGIFVLISPQDFVAALRRSGRPGEAAQVLRETWETQKRALGPDSGVTLLTARAIAELLSEMGLTSEEEAIRRQIWISRRRALGETHQAVHLAAAELAATWQSLGWREKAEDLQRQALEGLRRSPGALPSDVLASAGNLAGVLYDAGQYAEAETLSAESLAGLEALFGADDPRTLWAAAQHASILAAQGRGQAAEAEMRRVLAARRRVLGDRHLETVASINALAIHLVLAGALSEALPLLNEQVAALEAQASGVLAPTDQMVRGYSNLGYAAAASGRFGQAYGAYQQAGRAVQTRYASRDASGGQDQAKAMLLRYRYIFVSQISAGWALAH